MSEHGRFVFEPLFNLANGRPVGIEVERSQARDRSAVVARSAVWGARQLAEFDSGIAIAAALAEGVAELRAEGYGIAFDEVGRGFGLDLVAELAPDLVKIDTGLVARLPQDPRARTVVRALCDVCRATGVRVSAVGVTTPDELAAVRDHGITWAQGPLLATARRRPSTIGLLLPVDLLSGIVTTGRPSPVPRAAPRALPTLIDLAHTPVGLPDDATAEQVRQALADHPQSGCVVLLDADGHPTGFLDRNRFMLAISGPFGRALYAERPARSLADSPRTAAAGTDVRTALERCLSGDRTRSYDDLLLLDDAGCCVGVVRVTDLLQEATGTISAA